MTRTLLGQFGGTVDSPIRTNVYSDGTTEAVSNTTNANNTNTNNQNNSTSRPVVTNPNSPSSSANVTLNNQLGTALNNVVNPPKPTPLSAAQKWYMNSMGLSEEDVRTMAGDLEGRQAIGGAYFKYTQEQDAENKAKTQAEEAKKALLSKQQMEQAQADTEYGKLIDDIQTKAQGSLEQAKSVMFAANPYAATQLGADNAQTAINTHTQKTIAYATTLYNQAKSLRDAGYGLQASQVEANLNDFLIKSQSELANTITNLTQEYNQNKQTAKSFEATQRNVNQDNLMNLVNTFSGSPELQSDLDAYTSSGVISPALEPFFKTGASAGLGANEVASMLKYGTDKARKDAATLEMQQRRLEMAADKQSYQQLYGTTQAAVLNAGSQLSAKGIQPGTIDYATTLAMSTAGSPLKLSTADIDKYSNIMSLSSNLSSVRSAIDAVDSKSSLFNIAISHAGQSVQSLKDSDLAALNGQMNALASRIGKSVFAETGNLSNTDIQRFLSIVPNGATTKDVRDAMYKFITNEVANRAVIMLQNDAAAFKPVAGFVQPIKQVHDSMTALSSAYGNTVSSKTQSILDKYGLGKIK